MTGWCSNIGDALPVMLRPGNADDGPATDHIAVLDAAHAEGLAIVLDVTAEW